MLYSMDEIVETIGMVHLKHLDIRTVTMGINLMDCSGDASCRASERIYQKIVSSARHLVPIARELEVEIGVPIINKRISITPISLVRPAPGETYLDMALALDLAARECEVDFLGGFSALLEKGISLQEQKFLKSIPEALASTQRICSSINAASSKAGINMNAISRIAEILKETAYLTRETDSIGCAKFVVFANAPSDNPFMAGAFHGPQEGETVINVGISGPGVVAAALEDSDKLDFTELADLIKRISFKITRTGELVGKKIAKRLGIPFGVVDISLAPTPAQGDSVAEILENMGIGKTGGHGTILALAMLNDSVKKGGVLATSFVGGLSGAFIPVSEDAGMISAVKNGVLSMDKLLAMTSVCSVGLDMVAVEGHITTASLAALIGDEMAIGVINNKTTACRIIPAYGKTAGMEVNYGGLLGTAPVMKIPNTDPAILIRRGGIFPPPISSLRN